MALEQRLDTRVCRVCGAEDGLEEYAVREMMFGLRDEFLYFQCGRCGCLQIAEVPEDLARYYPAAYYAYQEDEEPARPLQRALRRARNAYAFSRRGALGRLLYAWKPYPRGAAFRWLQRNGLTLDSRILDVGCGSGGLLRDMRRFGYRDLLGVDPYIDADIEHPEGVRIRRATIHEMEGPFDLVMFHHAFEHIPDQRETLETVASLLAPGGECLIRMPTVSSYAWEHYREHWVQLDAPRHLLLHSRESLARLAGQAGLELAEVQHDSTELQFVGSELYRKGVALVDSDGSHFSVREMGEFRRRAEALNREGRGDSAAFFLRRAAAARAGAPSMQRSQGREHE
jgi:SAM-dependent methyltransferase